MSGHQVPSTNSRADAAADAAADQTPDPPWSRGRQMSPMLPSSPTRTTRSSRSPVDSLTYRMSRQQLQIGHPFPQPHGAILDPDPDPDRTGSSSSAHIPPSLHLDSASLSPADTPVASIESTRSRLPAFLSMRYRRQQHYGQSYKSTSRERVELLVENMVASRTQCNVRDSSLTPRPLTAVDPDLTSSLLSLPLPPIPPITPMAFASAPAAPAGLPTRSPLVSLPIEPDPSMFRYSQPLGPALEVDPAFTGDADAIMEDADTFMPMRRRFDSMRAGAQSTTTAGATGVPNEDHVLRFLPPADRIVRSSERALRCSNLVWNPPRMRKRDKSRRPVPASERGEARGPKRRDAVSLKLEDASTLASGPALAPEAALASGPALAAASEPLLPSDRPVREPPPRPLQPPTFLPSDHPAGL